LTGSMQIVESEAGSNTYNIECTGVTPVAKAQVKVDFTTASTSGSGSGGSGSSSSGGGGAIDKVLLLLLTVSLYWATYRRLRAV